jgi:hypothetical protein
MCIRMEVTVDFDHDLPTLPMGGPKDVAALSRALEPVLRQLDGAIGACLRTTEFHLDRRATKGAK